MFCGFDKRVYPNNSTHPARRANVREPGLFAPERANYCKRGGNFEKPVVYYRQPWAAGHNHGAVTQALQQPLTHYPQLEEIAAR